MPPIKPIMTRDERMVIAWRDYKRALNIARLRASFERHAILRKWQAAIETARAAFETACDAIDAEFAPRTIEGDAETVIANERRPMSAAK